MINYHFRILLFCIFFPVLSYANPAFVNTGIVIEAESVSPRGYWKQHTYLEETPARETWRTGLLFDPPKSFLNGPVNAQTLTYRFKTKEAATYRLALFMARDKSKFSKDDPGGSGNWGDQRNNDVYLKLIEANTNKTIYGPTRLFFGGRKDLNDRLVWGNHYDNKNGGKDGWKSSTRAEHALKANTEYKLEVTGRGDGVIVDKITVRSNAHLQATAQHSKVVGQQLPKLPKVSVKTADLDQYHAMKEWSRAGVEGGIPNNLQVKKTINPGSNIQAAIDEVANAGGGVVLLRNGVYKLSGNTRINMKSKVVLRGESREGVRIESRLSDGVAILFNNVQNAGVENLTYQFYFGNSDPQHDKYTNSEGASKVTSIQINTNSKNNWVKNSNIINSGLHPIVAEGEHNTFTGNYVDGSYNKSGGSGYYNIRRGKRNLVKGETIKNLRHLGILTRGAAYNVIVDNFIATDVNFHTGDVGHNLVEGNSVSLPKHHGWSLFGTGHPAFTHMTPGDGNLVVNNHSYHERNNNSINSIPNVVYMFEGYLEPVPTAIKVPKEGRFYVPAWPDGVSTVPDSTPAEPDGVQNQISFTNPTPKDKAILNVGSNIDIEVVIETQGDIQSVMLYRNNVFVRQELLEPYEWSSSKDSSLKNLAEGSYEFRAEATLTDGTSLSESFTVVVGNTSQLNKRIEAESFDAQSGIQIVQGKKVGFVNSGDWIRFNDMSITQASSFTVNAATPTAGGTLEVRSNSATGPLLGSVEITNTSGWDNFVTFSTSIAPVSENTDIFLVFKRDRAGYLFDIDYFQFD